MAEYLPVFKPGQGVTYAASADVVGGRLVQASGSRTVAHATADSATVVGVAGHDAKSGEDVVVYGLDGMVHRLTAAGAIVAAARVAAAADGKVATLGSSENPIGVAVSAAAAADAIVQVKS